MSRKIPKDSPSVSTRARTSFEGKHRDRQHLDEPDCSRAASFLIRVCHWPIDPSKPIPAAFSVLRSYKPKRTRHVLSFSARHPVTGEPNPKRLRRYNDDLHF